MSDRGVSSRPPEPARRVEDGAATPASTNPTTSAISSPSPPSTTPAPTLLDPVWLRVYDRASRNPYTVQIQDPGFLRILNNSVVPAAEGDGMLPFEMHEFVEYVDAYETERVRLHAAAAARRNGTGSSGSVGYASGGIYGSNNNTTSNDKNNTNSSGTSFSTGNPTTTSSGSTNANNNNNNIGNGATPALKLEETLRQTLDDNSDFFFRVASVAYQLEPATVLSAAGYKAAQTLPTAAGGTGGAGIRGTGATSHAAATSLRGRAGAETALARGAPLASSATMSATTAAGQFVSAATNGVTAMLASTLTNGPATPPVVHHRNYAVDGGYSAAFHLCGRLFAMVYRDHCHALAERISARFSALRLEDCVKFRKAVWTGFHLKAADPQRSAARSESNLELRWVSEKIKDDKHLFPDGGVIPQQQQMQQQQQSPALNMTRIMDATLSYVANARRRVQPRNASANGSTNTASSTRRESTGEGAAAAAAATAMLPGGAPPNGEGSGTAENEMQTFGLTKLLHNPSWQKDEESSDTCPSCGRAYLSVSRPLGARAHHCRSCGVRLCVFCITKRAHYSFAKLTKPGSVDESEERFVCDVCYGEYEATRQLHYLGALFAIAGLGFSDLVLCRTVNEQWREAAELCISEYRLLLHNCDADMHSVMTPVGILLQNSLFLLLGEGPTASISVVHHPEAALLLLKFIATENLWMRDGSYYFITRLSTSILNRADTVLAKLPSFSAAASSSSSATAAERKKRAFQLPVIPTLSHWHLFCTAFCTRISSSFFFVKCAELLCAAPARVYDAYVAEALERMTRLYLNTTPLWTRLATANRAAEAAFHDLGKSHVAGLSASMSSAGGAALPLPSLSDVTESQLVTIWLLDMLHKDGLVPAPRRRYQQLLERVIPTVAASSLSLVFILLLSLRSTYSYYNYDEELFGQWRSRILAEVGRVDSVAKDRVVATLDFYAELDRFCAQSAAVNQVSIVDWIVRYCARGRSTVASPAMVGPMGSTGQRSTDGASAAVTQAGTASSHPATAATAATTPPQSQATRSRYQTYVDLPEPMLNPFKPYMVVRSLRLSGVRVAPNAATKPIWLAFSTWTAAEHNSYEEACRKEEAAAKVAAAAASTTASPSPPPSASPAAPSKSDAGSTTAPPGAAASGSSPLRSVFGTAQECMFLYKRENVERDQLMCISSRLLQMLLANEIGNAEMLDYSVLPLSCDSGLIEKAAGRELSSLENIDIASYVLQRDQQGCTNFLASAKIFLLLNYIFSIGDRHKGNVLIGSNGALLHIDFRFIFSEKTFVEKLARSTVRIDDAFLAAVEQCQLRQSAGAAKQASKRTSHDGDAMNAAATATSTHVSAAAAAAEAPAMSTSFFTRARATPTASPGSAGSSSHANPNAPAGPGVSATSLPAAAADAPHTPPTPAELRAAFFDSAAEWFVHVRPFAAIFYELWLYAVHRHTVPYGERELLTMLNTLFDRHASQASSAAKFSTTMKQSVNVCRLKDVTHSSAEVLRSFTDQVSRRVSESGAGAVKMMGTMWTNWWTRTPT